jgi:inhibitor of KinA sporulation pathway (predicted exonuclease)
MFIIFDTEYTAWKETQKKGYNMVTQFPEIVQIGALKVDKDFKIVDKLNMYIKPKINPELSEYFINLTKISQKRVDSNGISLVKALNLFYNFSKNNGKLLDLYSYGNDYDILKKNLDIHHVSSNSKFRKWKTKFYDIQDVFKNYGINTKKYTSGTVYKALNIKPDSKISVHNAEWDTYSIFLTLKKIFSDMSTDITKN